MSPKLRIWRMKHIWGRIELCLPIQLDNNAANALVTDQRAPN